MIGKRPRKVGVPKLKRCSAEKEEIIGGDDVEESCSTAVNSISVAQRVSKNKPPLLKSSRGRRQVLPMKFSDSVLHSWKKEKSECSDDLKSCLANNDEYAQNVPRNKKLKREESSACYDDIYLVKKPRIERPLDFRLKNIILEPYPSSQSSGMSVNEENSCVSPMVESGCNMNGHAGSKKSVKEKVVEKKADLYEPGDFVMGDIVWAKCGKNFPAWPAIVIDPLWQAPEAVLRACVPGTLCVMFYGYSRSGQRKCNEQLQLVQQLKFLHLPMITEGLVHAQRHVYSFHKQRCAGACPFFWPVKGQTKLYGSKPSDFHLAIEKAILAENGYADSAMEAGQETLRVTNHGSAEATGSNQESECTIQQANVPVSKYSLSGLSSSLWTVLQDTFDTRKDTRKCGNCGLIFPCRMVKRMKDTTAKAYFLCEHCVKLRKSKQYCGICKKIWHHSDGGSWVCCDSCDVWVHADCAEISTNLLKESRHLNHFLWINDSFISGIHLAPPVVYLVMFVERIIKFRPAEKLASKMLPDNITVVCNGVEETYYPSLHFLKLPHPVVSLYEISCSSFNLKRLMSWFSVFVVHVAQGNMGSVSGNDIQDVERRNGNIAVVQMTEYNVHCFNPMRLDKKQHFAFLKENYKPVHAKWTMERCAICRWAPRDALSCYSKKLLWFRCQIAVHQECYGVRNTQDFASWVCRACETPEVERECYLCPVKGMLLDVAWFFLRGALKPTDVESLWVHVTCAWFRPEIAFSNAEKMEPAVGLFRIPPSSFTKIHGSCIQCCKCATYFHATCASRAGYCMEDYAWIKAGMVFPFHEYMGRFQGQTKLYGSKPSDFHLAIEEAILAENGYADSTMETGQETLPVTNHGSAEATGSNQESECTIQQASLNCS
ncbi:UNVERIFIED_CONTAM: Histone-lysine N-methyltransferase ATX3 [Sesamum indicum]